jgi:hypothetical protein
MDQRAIAKLYTRFAETQFRGRSPFYQMLALRVAEDQEVVDFLMTLPKEKRQPNLLFAAVRHLFGTPSGWDEFRRFPLTDTDSVRSVMLTHSTQTNEPARCATLLPLLAMLPEPLALIEVGTSAGLCLLPDFYGYNYGSTVIRPPMIETEPPVFTCRAEAVPAPTAIPNIIWRAGLDLNPLDPADPAHAAWLETLVWPEQTDRLANLKATLKIAAKHKPTLVKGDLLGDDLVELCRAAPKDATLVVFHTAVLTYIGDLSQREEFADRVRSLCHYWISSEAPAVFPKITSNAKMMPLPGSYLLSMNGAPVAWVDPHGAWLDGIESGC